MTNILRLSSLIPAGLIVESTAEDEDVIVISARAGVKERVCPLCGKSSSRVHSQYVRRVSDLPWRARKLSFDWLQDASSVVRRSVDDGYLPNGLTTGLSRRDPAGPRVWNVSFTTWGWHSAAGRPRALPSG